MPPPGDWYGGALFEPTGERERFWPGLRAGEIGLSEIAASRLGVADGDTIELPTVAGPNPYRVAGIVRPPLWPLGSSVFYGFKIDWGISLPALRTGVATVFVVVLIAAVYPVIHARRLETAEVLRTS